MFILFFFQEYGGTRLGLSISKRLVNLMQGNIWVELEVLKGSKFFFHHFVTNIDIADGSYFIQDGTVFEKDDIVCGYVGRYD